MPTWNGHLIIICFFRSMCYSTHDPQPSHLWWTSHWYVTPAIWWTCRTHCCLAVWICWPAEICSCQHPHITAPPADAPWPRWRSFLVSSQWSCASLWQPPYAPHTTSGSAHTGKPSLPAALPTSFSRLPSCIPFSPIFSLGTASSRTSAHREMVSLQSRIFCKMTEQIVSLDFLDSSQLGFRLLIAFVNDLLLRLSQRRLKIGLASHIYLFWKALRERKLKDSSIKCLICVILYLL